jgi:hypothetical protein
MDKTESNTAEVVIKLSNSKESDKENKKKQSETYKIEITSNYSLQEKFQKFMKIRKEKRKIKSCAVEEKLSTKNSSFRANPTRMKSLRKKFIDRAICYLGTPYAKKYMKDNHPLYKSRLFLDCCGLVRQCVNDLSEEFGFRLGRWNQAYQFDILPDPIDFKDLKPGDLIFYEATHYKEKGWKDQPHNLVHVEIYLGDYNQKKTSGKKSQRTIASREKRGVVDIYDTFEFVSDNYYDIKYYFKSIDPWLKGINQSYCAEHKWNDELGDISKIAGRFSLFDEEESFYFLKK